MTRLGEIARVTSGGTPDRERPEYWGGTIPWVKTSLIQNCEINLADIDEFITEEGLKKSAAKIIPASSILMAMIGQGKTRGQVAILKTDAAINQNCAALILNEGIDARYVYQQLLYRYEELRNVSNSSGQQNLNADLIRGFKIPLADATQQAAIGGVLTDWDTAIETTERLIAAKERFYAHELSRLISRGQHPRRIISESTHKVATLGDFLTESREPDIEHDPGKRLTVRLHLQGVEARIVRGTESDGATIYYRRRAGQLIYGKQNIFRGAIGIIPNDLDGYCSSQDLPAFDISSDIDPQWLYYWLSRKDFYTSLEALAAGSGAKRLHPEEFFKIRIFLPDIATQTAIARYLNALREETTLLTRSLDALKRQKRGLMQRLLNGKWRVPLAQDATSPNAPQEVTP
ncbi:restriction endonuclease subunit S [Methylococcus capsulatus]|uniref:restriction endonuclease subunit S n=1 Tax=Methylococcus capsulatus TaxID=414 RepID=UPI001C529A00|nr:restriction endonuclease subunit S [Methylococcus capsulatus]QXP91175.1 restriction endonuclease subunit S [Methylococcus capsulatus]